MAKKEGTIAIKKTYLWGLLVLFGVLIGGSVVYYISVQKAAPGGADAGITLTREELFSKYAADLKLDKNKFEACLDSGKYTAEVTADASMAANIGARGTPTFVINGQLVPIGAAPYENFKKILDSELANSTNRSLALALVNERDPALGEEDAPIVMLEFSDFQCPFCGRFWSDTLPLIKKNYVETGKVLFVYKDFPLTQIHAQAQKAAEAALCAREQGKFWEYHDVLFDKQTEWAK